jgi:hypothetical protein
MSPWPENKKFAFTILDDTDFTTLHNAPIVYDYLRQLGLKTTKTVWMFDGELRDDNKANIGATCQDSKYLDWVLGLKEAGFEVALHSASWSRSNRDRISEALDLFRAHFGAYPKVLTQHNDSLPNESLYWGANRVSRRYRAVYSLLMRIRKQRRNIYLGESPSSPYFWGDICRERIKYVRNFVYADINTLKACPVMPYHDPDRPYVNYWFASTEGPKAQSFCASLSDANQDRLEAERGACIIYTHLGLGFATDGILSADFRRVIANLVRRDGWFVPVSDLLDHLVERNGGRVITRAERARLERRWLWHKIRVGTS